MSSVHEPVTHFYTCARALSAALALSPVCVSTFAMMFLLVSHLYTNPTARKWGTPICQFDLVFTSLALTHLLTHRDRRRTSVAPAGGAEIDSVRPKGSSGTAVPKQAPQHPGTPDSMTPAATPSMPTRVGLTPAGSVSRLLTASPLCRGRPYQANALRPSLSVGRPNSIAERTEDEVQPMNAHARGSSSDQLAALDDSSLQQGRPRPLSVDVTAADAAPKPGVELKSYAHLRLDIP